MKNIEITALENYGDVRGALYSLSDSDIHFLDKIQNIHFGEIRPNSIRGNHYHHQGKEILIISYSDKWIFAWAKKESAKISKKEFTGTGAVLVKVNDGIAHSVKNIGRKDLGIIALSDRIFSKENPDTFSKTLLT